MPITHQRAWPYWTGRPSASGNETKNYNEHSTRRRFTHPTAKTPPRHAPDRKCILIGQEKKMSWSHQGSSCWPSHKQVIPHSFLEPSMFIAKLRNVITNGHFPLTIPALGTSTEARIKKKKNTS